MQTSLTLQAANNEQAIQQRRKKHIPLSWEYSCIINREKENVLGAEIQSLVKVPHNHKYLTIFNSKT